MPELRSNSAEADDIDREPDWERRSLVSLLLQIETN